MAREGCVDETLSTFSAALEANAIDDVLNSVTGNTKYSNIDHDVLALMRDELKQISVEESSHSALAWRTLSWICSVDTKACTHVHDEVFKETNLRQRINQVLPNQKLEVLEMVHEQWMQVLASHRINHNNDEESHQQSLCRSVSEEHTTTESLSCISKLTKNIRRDLLC